MTKEQEVKAELDKLEELLRQVNRLAKERSALDDLKDMFFKDLPHGAEK